MSICQVPRPGASQAPAGQGHNGHSHSALLTLQALQASLKALLQDPDLDQTVAAILRAKLDAPDGLVPDGTRALLGSQVVFMQSGGGAQVGRLSLASPLDAREPGIIPVTSVLGATLLGMQQLQRATLPVPDGVSPVLVVLRIAQA